MTGVIIFSDFGASQNKVSHCFHCFPIYLPWSDGTWCHDLSGPVLTTASEPAYWFLRRQVRWSGIPISLRIFHTATENWIKDLLSMALPIRRLSFPYSQSLSPGSFHKPLILIPQSADRMKTTITENLSSWSHGPQSCLTQWNYEPCHAGPPKVEGSWWKVLTEQGPLERGMANHSSSLALRIPWTIWKGKKIGHWKMNSPGG